MVVQRNDLEPISGLVQSRLDESGLNAELDVVRERNQVVEARIEQLNQLLLAGRREESLLEDLLAVRSGKSPKGPMVSPPVPATGSPAVGGRQVDHPVVTSTIDALRLAGRPVHIGELMTTLQAQNIEIPGSGEQANLISYLRRDSRIVRPARGVYGLREWGLEDMEAPATKAKKKRSRIGTRRTTKKKG